MSNKEVVGNIRIKETKSKKKSKNIGKTLFIWFMFIAMLSSFIGPLLYYLITIISQN